MSPFQAIEHPARYYIAYLISQRRYTAQQIWEILARQNLHAPKEDDAQALFIHKIKAVQSAVQYPVGYNPKNLTHVPTARWLRNNKIYDIHAGDRYITAAIELLDHAEIRRALEILLLGPLNFSSIAKRMQETFDVSPKTVTAQTVKYYSHYLWNTDVVPAPAMIALIRSIPGVSEDYYFAYQAPKSQMGGVMSTYVATKGGSGVPKEPEMFRFLRDNAFMEFIRVSATRTAGLGKATAMQQLANTIIATQEQLDMRRGGSAELLDELRRMETRYDDKRLTTIEELPINVLTAGEEKNENK